VASEAELKALLKKLSRPPSPPRFVFGEGGWRGVEKKGLLFDEKEALAAYREARASGRKSFRLPVRHIPPSLSLKDLYALGMREHLATGETDFRGSSRARAHNLLLASSRLDGLLIPPGPFAFNQALGPVTAEAGYQEAFVIVGDRREQGLGGGVCQVSTTLFIPFYAESLVLGHQWNRVCRLRVSGSWARTRHRSATTSIISSRSPKYRLATASFTKGHTRSTGWSSGE
jgi:vancomycin resistance protein YoaR